MLSCDGNSVKQLTEASWGCDKRYGQEPIVNSSATCQITGKRSLSSIAGRISFLMSGDLKPGVGNRPVIA